MTEQDKTRIIDLREKGMSFGDIAKSLSLSKSTVTSFFNSYLKRKDSCKYCGKQVLKKRNRIKLFCSDSCRSKWWNTHKSEIRHKTVYTFKCQCCGIEFTRLQNKGYKYCSYACFKNNRGERHEG